MIAKCSICGVTVINTRGDSPESKLDSMLTNFFGHLKKKHSEAANGVAELLVELNNRACHILLSDMLDTHKSTEGSETTDYIGEYTGECGTFIIDELGIGELVEPDTEGEEEDEDEEVVGEDGEPVDTGVRVESASADDSPATDVIIEVAPIDVCKFCGGTDNVTTGVCFDCERTAYLAKER